MVRIDGAAGAESQRVEKPEPKEKPRQAEQQRRDDRPSQDAVSVEISSEAKDAAAATARAVESS
jgi:hypothetical protein